MTSFFSFTLHLLSSFIINPVCKQQVDCLVAKHLFFQRYRSDFLSFSSQLSVSTLQENQEQGMNTAPLVWNSTDDFFITLDSCVCLVWDLSLTTWFPWESWLSSSENRQSLSLALFCCLIMKNRDRIRIFSSFSRSILLLVCSFLRCLHCLPLDYFDEQSVSTLTELMGSDQGS